MVKAPLKKNDHPDLDNTELCNKEQITKYIHMIGQLQWAISLGRYDILEHVMSMSRFRLEPKIGHLESEKIIWVPCENQALHHQLQNQRTHLFSLTKPRT